MTLQRRSSAARSRARRVPAWCVLGVLGSTFVLAGHVLDASAEDTAYPIELDGSGDSDIIGELVGWQNTLQAAMQPVSLSYFQAGSRDGRAQLLDGRSDFYVGGAGFTAEELASRDVDAAPILDIPFTVGALAIVATENPQFGWTTKTDSTCDPNDPDVDPDSEACGVFLGEFTDPIRIPPENLAAMIVGLPLDFEANGLVTWDDPAIVEALGTKDLRIQKAGPRKRHTFLERTEASTASSSLLRYAAELGPTAWEQVQRAVPGFAWRSDGETFSPRTPSKYGIENQMYFLAQGVDPGSGGDDWTGNMGAVPVTLLAKYLEDNPRSKFRVVEIQNRHGDWLTPTAETIGAAVAAGTDFNVAATDDIAGAYPLVYVNRLHVLAGGMTVEKVNALAAAIRYVVTDGQLAVVDHGGVALTEDLVSEALAKTDLLVVANCPDDGHVAVVGGPGPAEPDTPGVQAIPAMLHCELLPPPPTTTVDDTTSTSIQAPLTTVVEPTTTVAAATTTTESFETSTSVESAAPTAPAATQPTYRPPSGGGGAATVPPVTTPPPETTVAPGTTVPETTISTTPPISEAPPTGGAGNRVRGLSLDRMPMDEPSDGANGFKKLGTLVLGASMFLCARWIARLSRARRSAT